MTRSELVQKINKLNPGITSQQAEEAVTLIFERIVETLAKGGRVELRGFGVFTVRRREARTGRNPRTGDSVKVKGKNVPFFKAGKLLRDQINAR
ncbi:MAG: integration host factor subunit beta [Alphaproteobacteria bacterium]|nr:integration host factor subunit beta [Alphaproteobacteria bacterium]